MDNQSEKTIRSKVQAELLKRALKQSLLLGSLGALIIIGSGTFLPLKVLQLWGIPLFSIGILVLAFGTHPFRYLSKLQIKPHKLISNETEIFFMKESRAFLKIPKENIQTMDYIERKNIYGIALNLKKSDEKIRVYQSKVQLRKFQKNSLEFDLFFPYFIQTDFNKL